jgi:lysophosphatidylcholine acyltransferase/lyso-PAF acetyltransferase
LFCFFFRALYVPIRFFSRAVYFFGGMHWISVYGEPDPNVPIMTVAPHYGYLDTLLFVYLNFTNGVARYGTEEVPVFGPLVKICQPIIVNREKYDSRSDTVQKIIERANSKLGWSPTVLFSEGTTTNGKAIIQFKPGAFIPGLPVQPICVKYFSISNFDSWTWTWKCKFSH